MVHLGETFAIKCAILEENNDHSCHIVTPRNETLIPIVVNYSDLENDPFVSNGVVYGEGRTSSITNSSQCGIEVKNASRKDNGKWFCAVTTHGKDGILRRENTENIHLRVLDADEVKTGHSKNKNLKTDGDANNIKSNEVLVNSIDQKDQISPLLTYFKLTILSLTDHHQLHISS